MFLFRWLWYLILGGVFLTLAASIAIFSLAFLVLIPFVALLA